MDVWGFVSVDVSCDISLLSVFDVSVVCFKVEVGGGKKEETDSIFYSHLIRSLFMQ